MANKPTVAQENAIKLKNCPVLVSAAAGSGKTSTLTEKIIRMIIGDENNPPMDISRMLIVTFTRSAAADLKGKITEALTKSITDSDTPISDETKNHLNKQLLALSSADICTIDSFYEKPVRQNFEKLGLPPSLRHVSAEELDPIAKRIMNGIIDTRFEKGDTAFTVFADSVTSALDSSDLADTLIKLYESTCSLPEGQNRLRECAERFTAECNMPIAESVCGKSVIGKIKSVLDGAIAFYTSELDKINSYIEFDEKLYTFLDGELTSLRTVVAILNTSPLPEISEALLGAKGDKINTSKKYPKDLYEQIRDFRTAFWKEITEISAKISTLTNKEIYTQYEKAAEICEAAADIIDEYEKQLIAEKKQRGICTFSDMTHYMLDLLVDKDGGKTQLAKEFSEKYDIVCIDEYQDVNEIQDKIFSLIGGSKRFMVGDIKQSIYGFRYAEPDIFAEYRESMDKFTSLDTEYPNGCGIFMSENFRCDENIIDFSNTVCDYCFSACRDVIKFSAEDRLVFGKNKPYPEYVSPKVEINIIDDVPGQKSSGAKQEIQAKITADRIAELLNGEKLSNGSPIKPQDIVILVRSMTQTKPLINQLEKRNIKVNTDESEYVADSPITKYVISLLDVFNNPHSDIPMSEAVSSKYFAHRLKIDDLLQIRQSANHSHSLYDAICECAGNAGELAEKCRRAVDYIEKYRDASVSESADKLLRILSADKTSESFANSDEFTAIYDVACSYVKNSWNGLYGFLKFYHNTGFKGDSYEFTKKDGFVSLITMHKSKGLQFPVTVLYNCGKAFNNKDLSQPLIFEKQIGIAVPEKTDGKPKESIIRSACISRIKRKNIQEEMRILYVAMTRAQERLIISGCVRGDYTPSNIVKAVNDYEVYKAGSHMAWILNSIDGKNDSSFTVKACDKYEGQPIVFNPKTTSSEGSEAKCRKDVRPTIRKDYSDLMREAPKITENSILLASIPVKAAASHIKPETIENCVISISERLDGRADSENPDMLEADTPELIKKRIELMRSESKGDFETLMSENKKPTAAERGTAIHKFLQFCDYARAKKHGVENEIALLLERQFISRRTADIINRWQANAFLSSRIFDMISNAVKFYREYKFNLFVPIGDYIGDNVKLRELVGDRTVYIQGSIDLLLEMPDGKLILCDYKSDYIPKEIESDEQKLHEILKETHGTQLEQYKKAIYSSFGRIPDETYIYSTVLGKAILV